MNDATEYPGGELELFAAAVNWKRYLRRVVAPFLVGDVLEVGAGIGSTTRFLRGEHPGRWRCLEPDLALSVELRKNVSGLPHAERIDVSVGTLADVPATDGFDTLLYVDVLEHIWDDRAELRQAAGRLRSAGRIVTVSPAHQLLFTPFDEAIGHHRRYDRDSLLALSPPGMSVERCQYLDSVGMLASLGNRALLRSTMPTKTQIAVWDRLMVPLSRWLDPALGYRVGKSIFLVWRKPAGRGK